jgi:ABC-2 type transport system permease protein
MAEALDPRTMLATRKNPLLSLLRCRTRAVINRVKGIHRESLLKVSVVTVLGSAFWLGLFFLFMYAFDFLNANAFSFRVTLIRHILSLFFVALLFMLVFSNAVISFQNLFRSSETAFLFSLPISHDTIFLYKLIESLIFSSWAVFAAGMPLLLAYGIKSEAPWYFYPLVLVFMVPFVILPAAIGALMGLLLTAVVPKHGGKVLTILAMILVGLGTYIGIAILNAQSSQTSYNTEMQAAVASVLSRLGFTQHYMTPNFWITEALLGISEGRPDALLAGSYFFAALATTAMFFLALGWFLSGSIYISAYSGASAGEQFKRIRGRTFIERVTAPLAARHPEIMLLVIKDIKTFLRDPAQWSQVLIFFGILTLYIGNLRNFSYPLEQPFYKNLISFLNLGATCMTLATMTSRFVFPLISLEGRRFWILGLVPLSRRNIMLAKFYFALLGSLLLTTSLILLSNYILSDGDGNSGTQDAFVLRVQLATGVLISIGLSGLSVGMGAIFPSFSERNPSKIVSGFGGTLTLILAIGLVVFSIIGEGVVCHRYLVPQLTPEGVIKEAQSQATVYVVMGGVALLNLLCAYIPMKAGIRALEEVEF